LYGDDGDDLLEGGEGDDFLLGGDGNDVFAFKPAFGSDFIADFLDSGDDIIELDGFSVSTFTALQSLMTEYDGNTFINFGDGSEIALQNVSIAQLTSDDFRFV
jgi:Ca2+-binding RTX toxin-like protein